MAVITLAIDAETQEKIAEQVEKLKLDGFLLHGDIITNTEHDGRVSYRQEMEKVI